MRQRKLYPYSLPFLLTLVTISFASSNMILTPNRPLGDGETLISAGGTFELGFFSPGSSTRRYLGIWYKHIPVQTVVWVANRDRPLPGRSGLLHLTPTGNLTIIDASASASATKGSSTIWASDPDHPSFAPNPVLELLDSGNLIVRDRSDHARARIAWQSFHRPTDTWLPEMRFSSRFELGLTSWRDGDDPAQGDYTVRLDDRGLPQLLLLHRSEPLYSTGAWNGLRLSGVPETPSYTGMFSYAFFSDGNATYYEHRLNDPSLVTRLVLDRDGVLQRYLWVNRTGSWNVYWSAPRDQCDVYGACGPYGVCSTDGSPPCRCLDGFERRPGGGCRRRTGLGCGDRDGFRRVVGLKLPDTKEAMVNRSMGLGECRDACAADCECVAYSSANISGEGSGCVMWVQDLMDLRLFARGGQDLFVRLAASELVADDNTNSDGQSNGSVDKIKLVIIIAIIVSVSFFVLTSCLFLMWRRKLQGKAKIEPSDSLSLLNFGSHANLFTDGSLTSEDRYKNAELLMFSFATINGATDKFSIQNKLGEGGFGPVYKGKLCNGQEVAVKRLSSISGQGLEEFKNEVTLIARLQHMNLVRLLGFCIQGEEKMLVYEYMHNKSLDSIIFDPSKASILDWDKRIRIIDGIAQGLLYLHKYSRLRVIHRDLKASNILLDNDMNPKISDFGMARIFGGDQNEGNTKRVVGTYGYMPPEYALQGIFSEKSDVFSFGVLLLEIISGKKNVGFRKDDSWNLLAYAWELSKEGRAMELMDPVLGESYSKVELLNCIHIGLLCVQQSTEDRPTMSSIISLLSGSNKNLPPINQPAFYTTKDCAIKILDSDKAGSGCSNELTITLIDAR